MKLRALLPLIVFLGVAATLWRGLSLHPNQIPSPLINKPAPTFQLPTLFDPQQVTSKNDLMGHVTLLNVWATWCYACAEEHEMLLHIVKEGNFVLYGLNYKDEIDDAKKWLTEKGNPYKLVAVDALGTAAIDWGVYGTPESFIIDKRGIVRYKQTGPITVTAWEKILKPLIEKLQGEP